MRSDCIGFISVWLVLFVDKGINLLTSMMMKLTAIFSRRTGYDVTGTWPTWVWSLALQLLCSIRLCDSVSILNLKTDYELNILNKITFSKANHPRMCVFPATWQRWRSHRSICRIRKPPAARKLHGSISLSCTEAALFPIEVYTVAIGNITLFCSCDLDLNPMTFTYELDPYIPWRCTRRPKKLSTSRLSKVIVLPI